MTWLYLAAAAAILLTGVILWCATRAVDDDGRD